MADQCAALTLLEAWQRWGEGNQLMGCHLWGKYFIYWGRLGKIIQLASALIVIAEIAGPSRMLRGGTWLYGTSKNTFFSAPAFKVLPIWRKAWVAFPATLLLGGSSAYWSTWEFVANRLPHLPPAGRIFIVLITSVIAGIVSTPYLLVTFRGLCGQVGLILRTLGVFMMVSSTEASVKIIGLMGFLIGFHFDLLAS